MKTVKKILALVLVIALTAAAAVNITLAYLQDEDEAVNVMTLGNVYIDQIEQERDASGKLQSFTQKKPLFPAVYDGESIPWADAADWPVANDEAWKTVAANENVIDKFVTVTNTGASPAYVRTIIAYEGDAINGSDIHIVHNADLSGQFAEVEEIEGVVVNGVRYDVIVYTYADPLAPGATTIPSLKQVYMDNSCDNEEVTAYGESYDILVLSQAVQTLGFSDSITALTTGFGAVNADNVKAWFGDTYIPGNTYDAAQPVNGVITLTPGKIQTLSGEQTPVTVSGSGTLVLQNLTINAAEGSALALAEGANVRLIVEGETALTGSSGGSGIYVPTGAALELTGGKLTAIGNGGSNDGTGNDGTGGHGIGGAGAIYIHDMENLTAQGYGKHGFGIGGNTPSITIEDTKIETVQGGYIQSEFVKDTSHGKDEPEGGAAIGSSYNGAVITLKGVTIESAKGGSKSAGIGAQYWTGVTVNISDSTINVEGGNASAGIGGSRVPRDGAADRDVTINIHNSTITAVGGQFGAGIGSGYDTYCHGPEAFPIHTINITGNSVINATGGQYAAGIGTGYHVGGLAGSIEDTVTVNATSGGNREKYTIAMDVGFGVIDHTREGKDNTCSFDYKGTPINIGSTELVNP